MKGGVQNAVFTMGAYIACLGGLASANDFRPNDQCCDLAPDEGECLDIPSVPPPTSFDNCVGGIGVDCEGMTYDIDLSPVGTISIGLVNPIDNGDGTVTLKVAVGSILHDLCCAEYNNGAFCNRANYPIDETLNLLGQADNDCRCIMEWRKAAWNLLRGRYWTHAFDKADFSSDLTPRPDVRRRSYLPTGSGTNYLPSRGTWGWTEVEATAGLCAPAGTRLDCPSEDDDCRVPCFGVTCRACASGCQRRHRNRWNKNGRDHANAGDSDYCCSGRFGEVYWSLSGTRYGVCA